MDSSTKTTQIAVEYDGVDGNIGKSTEKLSESRKIVKKPEKPQRSEKLAKAIGSEERLPKHQSSISNPSLAMTNNPSAPNIFLQSARLLSFTSALEWTPDTSASRQLKNLLRTSSLYYFNLGDALRKKTSKPRIRAESLEG